MRRNKRKEGKESEDTKDWKRRVLRRCSNVEVSCEYYVDSDGAGMQVCVPIKLVGFAKCWAARQRTTKSLAGDGASVCVCLEGIAAYARP